MDDWFWTQDRNLSIIGYCTQIVSATNQTYLIIDYIPPNWYRIIKNRKLWTLLNIFNPCCQLPSWTENIMYLPIFFQKTSSLLPIWGTFFFAKKNPNSLWIKTQPLTTPQTAPCRVWFWYTWRDDLQFARVHAPSPGWTDLGVSVVSAERCGIFCQKMDGWIMKHPPIS